MFLCIRLAVKWHKPTRKCKSESALMLSGKEPHRFLGEDKVMVSTLVQNMSSIAVLAPKLPIITLPPPRQYISRIKLHFKALILMSGIHVINLRSLT